MADNEEVVFFVQVVDATGEESESIQVAAKPGWSLASLLRNMKLPVNRWSVLLERISHRCNFYTLKDPFQYDDDNPPDVRRIMASLQDKKKYTHVGHNKSVETIAQHFILDYLYLVIVDVPDGTEMAIASLKQNYANLYRCLLVNVMTALQWTRDDVLANGGSFIEETVEKPPEIRDLEYKLSERRSFNAPDDNPDLSIARRYSPQFESSYFRNTLSVDQATVKRTTEFIAFYALLRCYLPDALLYLKATSSSVKAHALKDNFIIPPFFSGRDSTDKIAYHHEEVPWNFPLFISCPPMGHLPRKYTPTSDFSVWLQELDLPLIIGGIIFQANEQDRYRMLLHGIALARLVVELRQPESTAHPFIVAIYLTASMIAERYIIMKTEEVAPEKVYISQKMYDLTDRDAAIAFQREMYNLADELESILTHLDQSKRDILAAMKNEVSEIKSFRSSGSWSKPLNKGQSLNPATKESHDSWIPEDEDDLGVFADETVRNALDEMDYKVAYVAFGHPNIAPIVSCTDGKMVGCLKFVKDKRKEIEIVQYLAGLPSESNHTVRPLGIWPVTCGSIIAMPVAGSYVTDLLALDTHLWSLATQLFEAVKFMHDHNVAHMDLKPSNLLIPLEYGRLTIIDFGLSVQLKNEAQLMQGHAGTKGYIAPEVGRTKFRPICADLWSVGKVLQELCMLCRPSPSRDWLFLVSRQLLDEDPSRRPMMSEVLQWIANFHTVEIPRNRHSTNILPGSIS